MGRITSIQEIKGRLKKVLEPEVDIVAAYLFGSVVEGYVLPYHSDVDVAVLFDRDIDLKRELQVGVLCDEALHRDDVDVIVLNRAPINLAFRAVKGVLLFEKDKDKHADFLESLFRMYHDFRPRFERFLEEYREAFIEKYVQGKE